MAAPPSRPLCLLRACGKNPFCDRRMVPQRLKPDVFSAHTAQLKLCPFKAEDENDFLATCLAPAGPRLFVGNRSENVRLGWVAAIISPFGIAVVIFAVGVRLKMHKRVEHLS